MRKKIGLIAGPLLFAAILLLPTPDGLSPQGQRALAIAVLMAVWWVTEAVHIAATALIPLALFPLMSVLSMTQTAKRYGDPNIYLFMGGFIIAIAMQKWNLHRRLALIIISRIGGSLRQLITGFMLATAALSMWISNTATAVMMLPIAIAVISRIEEERVSSGRFGLILMLSIAYSASIGGVATLIGTPPNIILAGQIRRIFPDMGGIGFIQWIQFALPVSAGFLIIVWAYLIFVAGKIPKGAGISDQVVRQQLDQMGRWTGPEKSVMLIFLITALMWLTRTDLVLGSLTVPGWTTLLGLEGIHDGTIAMLSALLLFVIPVNFKDNKFLMDWDSARKIPWEVLILFGGGFALAESVQETGLAEWIGHGFGVLESIPVVWVVLAICLGMTFLTEVTSNTATATMLMPVLAAASISMEVHPFILMIPATISASFAFMLPVATPPNAIIFGSGKVSIPEMAKAGFVLNILGALWVTLMVFLIATRVFNI